MLSLPLREICRSCESSSRVFFFFYFLSEGVLLMGVGEMLTIHYDEMVCILSVSHNKVYRKRLQTNIMQIIKNSGYSYCAYLPQTYTFSLVTMEFPFYEIL